MIYFTSDLHIAHKRIIEYDNRPFDNVDDMEKELIENWNNTVKPDDTVYFLGDLSLNHKKGLAFLEKVNGNIIYIAGNHCPFWYDKKARKFRDWLAANPKVKLIGRGPHVINYAGVKFKLSHFPYKYVSHKVEQRRMGDNQHLDSYNEVGDEDVLLHGHVHTAWHVKGNQINVGCMWWDYKPVSIDQIMFVVGRKDFNAKLSERFSIYRGIDWITRFWKKHFSKKVRRA